MKVDDLYGIEWAYIPHFYTDFYVYQYATSISAAAYFAEGIEKGDTVLRDHYFDMLKSGGSDDPYLIVKRAGPTWPARNPIGPWFAGWTIWSLCWKRLWRKKNNARNRNRKQSSGTGVPARGTNHTGGDARATAVSVGVTPVWN